MNVFRSRRPRPPPPRPFNLRFRVHTLDSIPSTNVLLHVRWSVLGSVGASARTPSRPVGPGNSVRWEADFEAGVKIRRGERGGLAPCVMRFEVRSERLRKAGYGNEGAVEVDLSEVVAAGGFHRRSFLVHESLLNATLKVSMQIEDAGSGSEGEGEKERRRGKGEGKKASLMKKKSMAKNMSKRDFAKATMAIERRLSSDSSELVMVGNAAALPVLEETNGTPHPNAAVPKRTRRGERNAPLLPDAHLCSPSSVHFRDDLSDRQVTPLAAAYRLNSHSSHSSGGDSDDAHRQIPRASSFDSHALRTHPPNASTSFHDDGALNLPSYAHSPRITSTPSVPTSSEARTLFHDSIPPRLRSHESPPRPGAHYSPKAGILHPPAMLLSPTAQSPTGSKAIAAVMDYLVPDSAQEHVYEAVLQRRIRDAVTPHIVASRIGTDAVISKLFKAVRASSGSAEFPPMPVENLTRRRQSEVRRIWSGKIPSLELPLDSTFGGAVGLSKMTGSLSFPDMARGRKRDGLD